MLCTAALLGAAPPPAAPPPAGPKMPTAADVASAFTAKDMLPTEDPGMWAGWDGGVSELMNGDLSGMVAMLSTSDGGFPFAKYKWNVPDLVSTIDVPVVQIVNGLPVRFSAAVSKASPDFLLKYYVAEFDRAGLYIPDADSQLELGPPVMQLTALDTDNLISYTVILQVANAKQTTVVMGQGYLVPWLQRKKGGDDFAPLFPGAQNVMRTHTEGAEILQYTSKVEVATVESFYVETMKKSGYVRSEVKSLQALVFTRGKDRITVRVVKPPDKKETGVLIQRYTLPSGSP